MSPAWQRPVNEPQRVEPQANGPAPLKLVAKGLLSVERNLLQGMVRVSERDTRQRTQRLQLLDDARASDADVLIVDAKDPAAMAWARQQPWLAGKPVVWIDAATVPPGHTLARRPVQWPVLTILLARAIDQGPHSPSLQPHVDPLGPLPAGMVHNKQPAAVIGTPKILLVDDSALMRIQLRGELEQRGFEVGEADSAKAALQSLTTQRYHGVLMDVMMPDMDGYEGCRQIKAQFRGQSSLPVVMLTSKSSPFDRIRGKMAGCDAYLTKPVDSSQLSEVLLRHMPEPNAMFTPPAAKVSRVASIFSQPAAMPSMRSSPA